MCVTEKDLATHHASSPHFSNRVESMQSLTLCSSSSSWLLMIGMISFSDGQATSTQKDSGIYCQDFNLSSQKSRPTERLLGFVERQTSRTQKDLRKFSLELLHVVERLLYCLKDFFTEIHFQKLRKTSLLVERLLAWQKDFFADALERLFHP